MGKVDWFLFHCVFLRVPWSSSICVCSSFVRILVRVWSAVIVSRKLPMPPAAKAVHLDLPVVFTNTWWRFWHLCVPSLSWDIFLSILDDSFIFWTLVHPLMPPTTEQVWEIPRFLVDDTRNASTFFLQIEKARCRRFPENRRKENTRSRVNSAFDLCMHPAEATAHGRKSAPT